MRRLLSVLFVFGIAFSLQAQDKHFTQFYASPLTLNPALTGAFQGRYSVGLNYRDQWRGALDEPFRTFSTSLEVKFPLKDFFRFVRKDNAAVGLLFFSDKVGGVDFNTTQIAISAAYQKSLDDDDQHYLMLGFQGGIAQRNVGYSDFTFEDQFNGLDGYTFETLEVLPSNNYSFADYSVGLNYSYSINRKLNVFAGGSYHHIFEPEQSFYPEDDFADNPLFAKISGQASVTYTVNDRLSLIPRALFLLQGPHTEFTAGSNVRYIIAEYNSTALQLGMWLRTAAFDESGLGVDALIVMAGLEMGGVVVGLSYDANLADLTTYQQGQGAFELSIKYFGEYDNETILCPKF